MLKTKVLFLPVLICSLMFTGLSSGLVDKAGDVPAVRTLAPSPNQEVFAVAKRNKPLELKSAKDAKPYFDADELKALGEAVDWDRQVVLVFAWRGSGQDKMEASVKETDDGELVQFRYKAGFSRDMRPHTYTYAVRKGVDWEHTRGR
ncbi:MAG: hypothetical protein AAGB26_13745 [Planctomycetota bacterium]